MGLQQPYLLVDILGRIRPLQKDCIYDYMNLSFGFGTSPRDSCVFLKYRTKDVPREKKSRRSLLRVENL